MTDHIYKDDVNFFRSENFYINQYYEERDYLNGSLAMCSTDDERMILKEKLNLLDLNFQKYLNNGG